MRAALVLLAACNQVYDLSPTVARDARYFDAPIDAPYSCPPIGTPLEFSPTLAQLLLDCSSYSASESRNLALAMCDGGDGTTRVSSGPLAGPLGALDLGLDIASNFISQPQLAADGTMFLLYVFDVNTFVGATHVYRDVAGTWVRDGDLPMFVVGTANPSSGPDRRILYRATASTIGELREAANGSWSAEPEHALAAIGVASARPLWLSPDALRLLIAVNAESPELVYLAFTERSRSQDPFGAHRRIDLPPVFDPHISGDCSRVYFSGLRSVFYAPQL